MTESFFINPQNKKSISCIYSFAGFNIHTEVTGIKTSTKHQIHVDKLNGREFVQIRVCELNDQTRMLLCTIDNILFEKIKIEQLLNVSFDGFVDHLIKILDACKRGELHISLLHEQDCKVLQFYEKRSFRNLIHLSLPIQDPPVRIILYYINETLGTLQQQCHLYNGQTNKLQKELEYKDQQIHDLNMELNTMSTKLAEQENLVFARNTEHISRLQQEIKHLTESRVQEVKKLTQSMKLLQDKVDFLTKENFCAGEKISQESKKQESLNGEICHLKSNLVIQKEENERLKQEINSLKNHERKNNHLLTEVRKQMLDLQEQIKSIEKHKSELEAELEAEKNICHIKRNALQIATEEISKANSIIKKQSTELSQLNKKVDWRTEVALQQEKTVTELEKNNLALKTRITEMSKTVGKNENIFEEMERLRQITDHLEEKYSKKIQDLQNKLSLFGAEKKLQKNAQRYLQISNKNNMI